MGHVSRAGTFMLCGSHEGMQEGLLLPKQDAGAAALYQNRDQATVHCRNQCPGHAAGRSFLLSHQPEGRPKHGSGRREHVNGPLAVYRVRFAPQSVSAALRLSPLEIFHSQLSPYANCMFRNFLVYNRNCHLLVTKSLFYAVFTILCASKHLIFL